MHDVKKIKENLFNQLADFSRKEKMTMGDLETIDKLLHSIKNAYKIDMYEEQEDMQYSEDGWNIRKMREPYGYEPYERGSSYARGRMRAKRDSMGRYSRADKKEMMIDKLEDMMDEVDDEKDRQEFRKLISRLERE